MNDTEFLAWAHEHNLVAPEHQGKSAAFIADNALIVPDLTEHEGDTVFEFLRAVRA